MLQTQRRAAAKIQSDLEAERACTASLRADNAGLKQMIVNLQASAEVEEEYISNMLLKRIRQLQREKGELLLRVEAEEEMITNQLQKKLQQLQKDKIEIESALEKEQEFMVNRLQKQLDDLRMRLGNGLSVSTSSTKKWTYPHSNSSSMSELPSPTIAPGVVEVLKAEVNATRLRLNETEAAFDEWSQRVAALYAQLREVALTLVKHVARSAGSARSTGSAGSTPTASAPPAAADGPASPPQATQRDVETVPTRELFEEQFPAKLVPPRFGPETPVGPSIPTWHPTSARSSITHRSPSASPILGQTVDMQPYRMPRSLGRSYT
nr:hypothetical protein HK105_001740 [Polyrhizophydium stewartii]